MKRVFIPFASLLAVCCTSTPGITCQSADRHRSLAGRNSHRRTRRGFGIHVPRRNGTFRHDRMDGPHPARQKTGDTPPPRPLLVCTRIHLGIPGDALSQRSRNVRLRCPGAHAPDRHAESPSRGTQFVVPTRGRTGRPSLYEVHLDDYDIQVRMAATKASAVFDFVYPACDSAYVVVDAMPSLFTAGAPPKSAFHPNGGRSPARAP